MERKAFGDTKVPVDRSRGEIAKILAKWGALGVQWEDDFTTGTATLRFRWRTADKAGEQIVARLRLQCHVVAGLEPARRDKACEQERRRLHRVAFHWLRAQQAAVDAGLFKPESVIMPWIEDGNGKTLAEVIAPMLGSIGRLDTGRMLTTGSR